jgi:hypothetical protein
MKTRTILLLVALVAAIAAMISYRMVDAKPSDAADRSAEVSVKATALYAEFVEDEVAAGKRYNDKVVEVDGIIRDITTGSDGGAEVHLETGDPLGAVVCTFNTGKMIGLTKGGTARIKGFCAGYNLDVLLQRCSVVE